MPNNISERFPGTAIIVKIYSLQRLCGNNVAIFLVGRVTNMLEKLLCVFPA